MKVAIAQRAMYPTFEENLADIVSYLALASERGSDLVVFPELAVTGFHRGVPAELAKLGANSAIAFEGLQAGCLKHGISAWIGLPNIQGETIFNSYVLISSRGELLCDVRKVGLMASEHRLFEPGDARPVIDHLGYKMSAVICREVGDLTTVQKEIGNDVDLLIWPGYVSNVVLENPEDYEDGTKAQAAEVARSCNAKIIQCNWANGLNDPERRDLGGSSFIDEEGSIVWSCPWGEPGLAVVDLETNQCCWGESV